MNISETLPSLSLVRDALRCDRGALHLLARKVYQFALFEWTWISAASFAIAACWGVGAGCSAFALASVVLWTERRRAAPAPSPIEEQPPANAPSEGSEEKLPSEHSSPASVGDPEISSFGSFESASDRSSSPPFHGSVQELVRARRHAVSYNPSSFRAQTDTLSPEERETRRRGIFLQTQKALQCGYIDLLTQKVLTLSQRPKVALEFFEPASHVASAPPLESSPLEIECCRGTMYSTVYQWVAKQKLFPFHLVWVMGDLNGLKERLHQGKEGALEELCRQSTLWDLCKGVAQEEKRPFLATAEVFRSEEAQGYYFHEPFPVSVVLAPFTRGWEQTISQVLSAAAAKKKSYLAIDIDAAKEYCDFSELARCFRIGLSQSSSAFAKVVFFSREEPLLKRFEIILGAKRL